MSTAKEVARYIVGFFQMAEDPITNLKLQKLLYYVQGWHLGLYGDAAFDEDLQAWVHGPVQPSVYHEYKQYRWNPITDEVAIPDLHKKLKRHIDNVLEVYGSDSAYELERRTHREAPWKDARKGIQRDQDCTNVIKKKAMKDYFKRLADEA